MKSGPCTTTFNDLLCFTLSVTYEFTITFRVLQTVTLSVTYGFIPFTPSYAFIADSADYVNTGASYVDYI
jgi:hypothetical protein